MRAALRGSYTVEAAVILPVAIIVTVAMIQMGIEKYQQLEKEFQHINECAQTQGAATVYRLSMAEEVWEEFKWK